MSEVEIYLFAPKRVRSGWFGTKTVRGLKIDKARFHPTGNSYSLDETIVDGWVDVPDNTPDVCYVIRGRIEAQL